LTKRIELVKTQDWNLRAMIDTGRGSTELVQHSAYRGNPHRRKGANSHIIDMISLYRLHPPVGSGGGFYMVT